MTERLHFHFSLSCIGEGNGNPLQCSCLENPRDGGAWWAAISGVAQSCTLLKRLSSSISRLLSGYLGVGKSSNAMINYERHEQYKRAVTSHPWSSWLWKPTASITVDIVISSGIYTAHRLDVLFSSSASIPWSVTSPWGFPQPLYITLSHKS